MTKGTDPESVGCRLFCENVSCVNDSERFLDPVKRYVLVHQDSRTDGVWLWLSDGLVPISLISTDLFYFLTATSYYSESFITAFSGKKNYLTASNADN